MARQQNLWRQRLSGINPLLKIGICLMLICLALWLRQLASMGLLAAGLLGLGLLLRPGMKLLAYGAIALLLVVALSAGLRDGSLALLSGLRLLVMLLPAPLLAATTPPAQLVKALQAIRLPVFLTLSVMLIWRFLPLMQQETQRILDANQLRGVNLARQPQQWFTGLFMPLIFRMVTYADDVAIGLETRGYDPAAPRTTSQPLTWSRGDTLFGLGSLLWMAIAGWLEWRS